MLHSRKSQGFTLIELLVVVSIIALLIGILLPALGKAREAGQMSVDMSNSRSTGLALHTYNADNRTHFPPAYQYRASNNFNETGIGTSSSTGYLQWSGVMIQGSYFDAGKGSIGPKHTPQGWAPTNFRDGIGGDAITTGSVPAQLTDVDAGAVANLQIQQTDGVIDTQARRLSYVPNEAIMGRLKTQAIATGNLTTVKIDEIEKASGTILMASYTNNKQAMVGNSVSGGAALKTHRPTAAVRIGTAAYTPNIAGQSYDGERLDGIQGGSAASTGCNATNIYAITHTEALAAIADARTNGSDLNHHIVYASLDMYDAAGSAYTFVDGHGQMLRNDANVILNTKDWKWGLRMYSQKNKAIVLDQTTGQAVN